MNCTKASILALIAAALIGVAGAAFAADEAAFEIAANRYDANR